MHSTWRKRSAAAKRARLRSCESSASRPMRRSTKRTRLSGSRRAMAAVALGPPTRTAFVVPGVLLGLAPPWEIPGFIEGLHVTQRAMHAELLGVDMRKQVSALEVPFFFFLGRHDRHVDAKLAASYFE